jgi:putative endonuclease
MYYVYAIKSISRNYIYVGMTNDLDRRINQHNNGKSITTKAYKPFILLYSEIKESREEARNREKYLKSGIGKEFLKALLK